MINIIIVDDHAVVRKGLIQILEEKPGLYSVDEVASGAELLEKITAQNHYDVIVLDISMQGKDGIDTLKTLKRMRSNIPVLVFSMYPEAQYAVRMLKSGAAGYLNKECAPNDFLTAIERVHSGKKYISPELAEELIDNVSMKEVPLHENLSDREFQVMCMIAKGKTPTQISAELDLSINTVSTYRIRILEKLKLRNSADITHYALKNKIVE